MVKPVFDLPRAKPVTGSLMMISDGDTTVKSARRAGLRQRRCLRLAPRHDTSLRCDRLTSPNAPTSTAARGLTDEKTMIALAGGASLQ